MQTPQDKVKLLQEKALNRSQERHQAEIIEKQRQWQGCKENAPEIALFLTELNKTFGKPAAVEVKIGENVILASGEFSRAKDLTVPKYGKYENQISKQKNRF